MFAGDDLRTFSKLHALYRLCQLVLASVFLGVIVYSLHDDEMLQDAIETCSGTGRFEKLTGNGVMLLYLYSSLAIFLSLISFAVLGPMHHFSGKGTPTDPAKRKPLFNLCYFDILFINFLRVGVFVVGAICLYVIRQYCACFAEGENFDKSMSGEIKEMCPRGADFITLLVVIVITHGVDTLMVVLTFLYFTVTFATPQRRFLSSERRCKICIRCCIACSSLSTCCLFGGAEAVRGDLADFALIMSNFLNNDNILDITASDVLIGLHMVQRLQKQSSLETRDKLIKEAMSRDASLKRIELMDKAEEDVVPADSELECVEDKEEGVHPDSFPEAIGGVSNSALLPSGPDAHGGDGLNNSGGITNRNESEISIVNSRRTRKRGEALSTSNARDVYLMAEAAHFMPLAQASYTWVSYMLEYPITGSITLLYRILRRCACIYWSAKGTIFYDYPWHPHTEALLAISGLEEKDVIYATYYESVTAIPYVILLDHSWKTVVVAIRGTLTLESVLTDVSVTPKELTSLGDVCGFDGRGKFCHAGMLASTEWVYNDLQK
jgi:hypothetical protein